MKVHTIFLLGCVTLAGVFLCSLPIYSYTVWGSDTGEYYYLASYIVENGVPLREGYEGWGEAYPWFPGFFLLVSAISLLTGAGILTSLLIVPSIIIVPSILAIFLIARRIFKSDMAALLASGFLAVAMPHVYTVSHPMPGSLGDTLLIAGLLALLIPQKEKIGYIFIPLSVALIVTHHLSSYFFLIAIIAGSLFRELSTEKNKRYPQRIKMECLFIIFFYSLMMVFWLLFAPGFKRRVLLNALPIFTPETLGILGLIVILSLPLIMLKFPRLPIFRKRMPTPREVLIRLTAITAFLGVILFGCICIGIPATTIRIPLESGLFFLPLIGLIIPAIIGSGAIEIFKEGSTAFGWFAGVTLSALLGVITGSIALSPYRHAQYMMIFLALLFACGGIISYLISRNKRNRRVIVGVFLVLILVNIPVAYPPQKVMLGFEEGIYPQEWSGLAWAGDATPYHTVYASDHRMSSMLFGIEGKYATWDTTPRTFHEENFSPEVQAELSSANAPLHPRQVQYIFLSNVMRQGVALDPNAPALPMTRESIEKFSVDPFIIIYDNGFTQIVIINWNRT